MSMHELQQYVQAHSISSHHRRSEPRVGCMRLQILTTVCKLQAGVQARSIKQRHKGKRTLQLSHRVLASWCLLQADIQALSIFKHHRGVVEDVAWHHTSPNTFGSVGDDKLALLWDKRHSGGIPLSRCCRVLGS